MSNIIEKSLQEWQQQLDAESFRVTRLAGTERPFSGRFYQHTATGHYHCICCHQPLFDSKTKFDAGCGWPSFSDELPQAQIKQLPDNSHHMQRIELRCGHCDAHLGHIFNDGPAPTGLRYCINSAALDFSPEPENPRGST